MISMKSCCVVLLVMSCICLNAAVLAEPGDPPNQAPWGEPGIPPHIDDWGGGWSGSGNPPVGPNAGVVGKIIPTVIVISSCL